MIEQTQVHECTLIVATADVKNFAAACRHLTEREIFDVLERFYEMTGSCLENSDGVVVKFMGDAALIVFPETSATLAIEALRALQNAGNELWKEISPVCQLAVRVHLGPVVCGPMGTTGEKRFDVIGNALNELFTMRGDDPFLVSETLRFRLTQ